MVVQAFPFAYSIPWSKVTNLLSTFSRQVHDPERAERSDSERSSRSDQANLHHRNDDRLEIDRDGSDER